MPKREVGKAPCPLKDCGETVAVFAYASKGDDSSRFTGRLFCVCPTHGRVENQKYFEAHTEWKPKPTAPAASGTGAATKIPDTEPAAPATDTPSDWLPNFFR